MTPEPELTIDDLARRVAMTTRNIRAHQSRGLLPAPHIRGRIGYYDEEHVARLELIKELQAEGFNLEAIRRILERSPAGTAEPLLAFTRAVTAPFTDEEPEVVDATALVAAWGERLTPELVQRTLAAGFVRPLGEGKFEILSPRLQAASQELADLGVPPEVALDVVEELRRHAQAVARAYVRLFLDHVWRPFEEAGSPEAEWPRVSEAFERLRPLASESLLAIFQLTMTETVERTLERELQRQSRRTRG